MQNYERKLRKIKKAIKNLVVENSALCDQIADVQNTIDVVKQEREFLLRKLIEHEPSAVEMMPQQVSEPKYKKRKNSSSDASSINKPLGRKPKVQQNLAKKQGMTQSQIPKMPVVVEPGLTVLSLGRIVLDRPAYYSSTSVYTVGFKACRILNDYGRFVCRIIDNGIAPLFEITHASGQSFTGQSTDECYSELLQAFENFKVQFDGDHFFGLTNPRVKQFLDHLPNAKRLFRIKQEIKQETLTFFDDNAACNYMMNSNV